MSHCTLSINIKIDNIVLCFVFHVGREIFVQHIDGHDHYAYAVRQTILL